MDKTARSTVLMIITCTVIVAIIVALAKVYGLERYYLDFLQWAETAGSTGVILTGLLLLLSVLFLLPSIYLTIGAGLLFGVIYGAALVVFTETLASVVAYAIGRSSLFKPAKQLLAKSDVFTTIDFVAQRGGWELVAATRLIPFFPFKLSNYAFGVSSVDFRSFTIGSFLGLWPIAIFNAYLGSIAGDVMTLGSEKAGRTSSEWIAYIAGFIVLLVLMVILAKRANTRLKNSEIQDK